MIAEINKLRTNPDSYIQILDSIRESYLWDYNFIVSCKKNDTVNLENWRQEIENDSLIFYPLIYDCDDAISFLKNVGPVPPLRLDSQLYNTQRNINYTNLYNKINDQIFFTGINCFESITPEREIIVVDLKTGIRTPQSDLQLQVYACMLERATGIRPDFGAYWMARQGGTSTPVRLNKFTLKKLDEIKHKLFLNFASWGKSRSSYVAWNVTS
jgi:hypothetical protein